MPTPTIMNLIAPPHARRSWKRRHNNRKRTKGRKAHTHQVGEFRGYVPNRIIRLQKWLRDEERALEIHMSKGENYRIDHMEEEMHMKARIDQLKRQLNQE